MRFKLTTHFPLISLIFLITTITIGIAAINQVDEEKGKSWWSFWSSSSSSSNDEPKPEKENKSIDSDFWDDDAEFGGGATKLTPPSEQILTRSVRETDDEDLIGGGSGDDEEGSGQFTPPTKTKRRFYRVTMTVSYEWEWEMEVNTSRTFRSKESELERTIKDHTTLDPTSLHLVEISNSSRGSGWVKTKFDMGVESESVTKEVIEEEFQETFKVGNIGQLRVAADDFSVIDIGEPLVGKCLEGELTCRNGECTALAFRCDGKFDCKDKTDEAGCPTSPDIGGGGTSRPGGCRADDQTRCDDGTTIICVEQRCDGKKDCPDGDDEIHNCTIPEDPCPFGQFQCDLRECKLNETRCNGVVDCQDGTDETDCSYGQFTCIEGEFRCRNGDCVQLYMRCNHKYDCVDHSDETNCPCKEGDFECGTGLCIPGTQRCDSIHNCQDKSDEFNCTKPSCLSTQFTCGDGSCVPGSQRCNRRIECPDGSDELNCPVSCERDEFTCPSDGKCLSIAQRCDFVRDCRDGEDEFGCELPPGGCSGAQFKCKDESCIDKQLVCDGFEDCPDGSDENPSTCPGCPSWEFRCGDGSCIPSSLRCNGRFDCVDGIDERNCSQCKAEDFRCANGGCVDKNRVCDFIPDCGDGSDEDDCQGVCSVDDVLCGDGTCVAASKKCDGVYDCTDGTDERFNCQRKDCQDGEFRCGDGECIENRLKCDGVRNCRDGSDESSTECAPVGKPSCFSDEFTCGNGDCVPEWLKCDGTIHCFDGSDEQNCQSGRRCRTDQFACTGDGRCIEDYQRCNGRAECSDQSDEINCERCTNSFRCSSGQCVGTNLKCNGRRDCSDGSDESDCEPQCRADEFTCQNGRCIQQIYRCDGNQDCTGGDDERNCGFCKNSFRCGDGRCISSGLQCNGQRDCPDGADELNCSPTCTPDKFQCDNGQCIPKAYKCDNLTDCADSSDEDPALCGGGGRPICNSLEFQCLTGNCVPRSSLCNSLLDCPDGSDEYPHNCPPCRGNEFRCNNGLCIPATSRCNRVQDCRDGSDEANCPSVQPVCRPGQFSCRSRDQCVPLAAQCNGQYECNDFSDEDNCPILPPEGLNLKTYPTDQTIKQGNEVVFQCRDEGALRAPVKWSRGNGLPLPPGTRDVGGRLEMPSIGVEHTGTYICEATGFQPTTPGSKVSVYLRVDPYEAPPTRPPSACGLHQATCANGDCIAKSMVCDGDKDCSDGSDEMRCRPSGCEPNEFQCSNKRCVPKTWRCDGDDDCGDGTDESACSPPPPGSPCRYNEFQCRTGGQCIPKAFHCDKEMDCVDLSDEFGCSPPTIEIPPPPLLTIDVGDVFNISCRARGIPTPEVIWRLNWGHVPEKCTSRSAGGSGVLTCPSIQVHEQGAYSCEAINSLGSTFAIPDCTLVVRPPGTVCSDGFFNNEAISPRDCLSCFCFGHTSHCSSVSLYSHPLPQGEGGYTLIGVKVEDGLAVEVNPASARIPSTVLKPAVPSGVTAQSFNTKAFALPPNVIPFFSLPPSHIGNQLKSYGGNLRYTLRVRGGGPPLLAPDVVMRGNGKTLVHVAKTQLSGRDEDVVVGFEVGKWFRAFSGAAGVEPASREEILMVLAKLDHLLIRAQYESGSILDTTITNIRMDSASTRNAGIGSAFLVEECRCPPGYTGLSCEDCAPGYTRRAEGPWLGTCVRAPIVEVCPPGSYSDLGQCRPCPCPGAGRRFGTSCFKDTDGGITCSCNSGHTGRNCQDCAPGYEQSQAYPHECKPAGAKCDAAGSVSPTPDPFTGRCQCKDLATGGLCSECKPNSFHLSTRSQYGCTSCFCMGITKDCASSNWYRIQETPVLTSSGADSGFTLTDETQMETIKSGISVDSDGVHYKGFSSLPPNIYYWSLPLNFLGDKVTSYGGHLNYTVRYVPPPGGQTSPNNAADVEINGNDIRLLYYRKGPRPLGANRGESVSVPLMEQFWQRKDGQSANREHLLMALANLDSLLIKATYTTSTRESYLSDVVMDYAVGRNTGQERAFAVEECACPQGYVGLSCEECAFGYTRSLRGLYLGLCEPCSCNGQSQECDSKTGVCKNCRGHTAGDFCENCEDGYIGDPRSGGCRPEGGGGGSCSCDPRGSVRLDCPDGRNCICKGNVEGERCTLCRRGTFGLETSNPQGCSSCFCSGLTTECASANLYKLPIQTSLYASVHEFVLSDRFRTKSIAEVLARKSEDELSYTYPRGAGKAESLFWSLPPKFTGHRVGSYGGSLKVTRRYTLRGGADRVPQEDIDVILMGKNGLTLFLPFSTPILPSQSVKSEVLLSESAGWRHEGARMASREDLMSVLVDVEAILIRATFGDNMEATYLKELTLDDSVRHYTPHGVVTEVEECRCPPGYHGSSCERCGTNYYREPSDRSRSPYGSCVQCPCGPNAEGCRFEGGRVICECRPGFSGPNCQIREHLVVELTPVKVNGLSGRMETFECSYRSVSTLRISFETQPDWSTLVGSSPFSLPPPTWANKLIARLPLLPTLKKIICTITNPEGEVMAQVYSNINTSGGGSEPFRTDDDEIQVTISEPTVQTPPLGSTVSFRCSAKSLAGSQLRITWTKEGGSIPVGRARDDGRGLFVISDLRPSDSGFYVCTATDGQNQGTQRATLRVGGADLGPGAGAGGDSRPDITISPPFLSVGPGENVEFRCTATGFPPPRLTWSGGRSRSLGPHVRVDGGILSIPNARKSDEAEYFCTAENNIGSTSLRTILYVRGGEEEEEPSSSSALSPFGFVVTISPPSAQVRPGESIRFRCEASDRQAGIQWARIGGTLPPSASVRGDVLTLDGVREEDEGLYACTATGSASGQSAQTQTRLTVSLIGTPPSARIEPEKQTVPQGSPISLHCIASGTPPPSVHWSKVQGTLPAASSASSPHLLLPSATVEDRGVYVCTVENTGGKSLASAIVEVERREIPSIQLYPGPTQTVVKGASALFQCRTVAGIPSPSVVWRRADDRPLPPTAEVLEGGAIRFNRLTGDEKGEYVCTATNSAGTATATALLHIQVPPTLRLTPPTPLRTRSGERVRLECRAAEGDPSPALQWKRLRGGDADGVSLPSTPDLAAGPQVAVYEINRVTKADEGSYSCIGVNEAGTDEVRLQVLVDVNPRDNEVEGHREPPHRGGEQVYSFPLGSQAEIRCFQTYEGGLFAQLYLDWERSDGGAMPRDYHARDGVLYINDVRAEDAGRYSCTGTNQQGQIVLSVDARLEVIGGAPPRLELQPAKQVVRRGDVVNINCIATGQQPIAISWFKANHQPFPPSVSVNGPQITFRGIEVTDAGRYACRGTNAAGSTEAVAEVIVNAGPSPPSRGGRRDQTGFVGSTAELRCSVDRGGRVSWRKDGGALPLTAIPLGATLTLLNLKLQDAGRYTCETEEGTSEVIQLSVEVVGGGGSCGEEEFGCGLAEGGGVHCIPASLRCDGEFDCVDGEDERGCWNSRTRRTGRDARSRSKRAGGTGGVRVEISASKDLLSVGEDVEVRCDVTGDRNPMIRWTKLRGALGDNVQTFGNLLRVTDVQPENGGVYRCLAMTKSGVFEDDYALTIQANPDIPLNSENIETKTAPLGTTVMMECRTDLDPPISYTWSKQNGHISPEGYEQQERLTIPDLSPEDAGTYVCTATNRDTSVDIPTVLVVNGVVPHFTQSPASYMTLPTLVAYLSLDILISFKAEDKNGLILYNGQKKDGSGDFVSFGLSNGYPEFRFDVGAGPAVIRGNYPLPLRKWHTVHLTRDKSGGSMKVNEGPPFLGNVNGKKFQGLDLIEPLHLGGVPNFGQVHRLTGHTKGFVGCISQLILGGKTLHLLRDSQISQGISTCDTCTHHGCRNGGVCQEGLTPRGYSCICPPGYGGDDCETSGQACFPGVCGRGKCVNILGGFECYCPFGMTGVRCERDLVIYDTPSFSGHSFMSYPTPKALKKFKMGLKVRAESDQDGLLLYASQTESGNGDFTSLAIKDGHLEFQYDMGSGPALLRSKRAIATGQWVEISVERDAQEGELKVGDEEVVKGKSPGQTRGLNLNTQLYLGGYDQQRIQLNPHVKVNSGFKGCVSGVVLSGVELNLTASLLEGANIENCEDEDGCTNGPCLNGGTCHVVESTFKCSCLNGFYGRTCQEGMNFSESVGFRGEGYLELPNDLLPHIHPEEEEIIQLEISTKSGHGLILWHGQEPTDLAPDDFLAVGLEGGKIKFSWDLGSGEGSVISEKSVDDGKKHLVVLRRQGRNGSVQVDADIGQFNSSQGHTQTLNTRGNIYLGGCPNPPGMTTGKYMDGFVGCVHSLRIQDNQTLNLHAEALSAVNLGPCLSVENTTEESVKNVKTHPRTDNFYDYEDENDEFHHVENSVN